MGRTGLSVPPFALILAASWAAGTPAAGQDGARHALLIGVGQYRSRTLAPLPGALTDVQAMRKVLASRHGFAAGSIRVLADAQATREAIFESLRTLAAQAGATDTVYIHFSGYGSQVKDVSGDEKGDGLDETILPHDARADGIPDITDDELGEVLAGFKAGSVVVVLDAAHAGTGTRSVLPLVRDRAAPPDTRLALYERVTSRDVVPIEESYVLFGAAAAGQPALEVPVDGRLQGLFSYSLSRTLARASPGATPRAIFQGVKAELRRVQEQLGRSSMPRPQLEARWDLLDRPLFPPGRLAAGGERKAWLEVRPISAKAALLVGGAEMFGTKGSMWAIYPPGERYFRPRAGIAAGRVKETRGSDALLEIVSRVKTVPAIAPGSRAVPVSAPPPGPVPVHLGRMAAEQREKIGSFLEKRLKGVVDVAPAEEFARFVLDRGTEDGSSWELSDGTGLGAIETFEAADLDQATAKLEDFLTRSRNASELLALENLASSLELEVAVHRPQAPGAIQVGEKGIQLVADLESPRYRIRKEGEPRGPENSLQLEIAVNMPAYITVVDVDAEGKVNILFPNDAQGADFHPDGLVPGGERVLIPDSLESGNRAKFFLDYSPPSGIDTVRVFAAADLDTARRIREFALQIRDELGSLEEISALGGPDTSFELAPISFEEMQESLARPRGIIVVADTPEAPEVIDPSLTVSLEALGDGEPPLEEPVLSVETPAGEVGFGAGEPGISGDAGIAAIEPAIPGDWTAVSITILVEE
jgi:hypothetical protein